MDILNYNKLTDEILYEEGSIILFNHDGAEVRCRAEILDLAAFCGCKIKAIVRDKKLIHTIDNWMPDYWDPNKDYKGEMHEYMKNHLEDCTLWIDHEAEWPCRYLIEEAEKMGIEVITWDSGLRDKTNQLQQTIKTLAI